MSVSVIELFFVCFVSSWIVLYYCSSVWQRDPANDIACASELLDTAHQVKRGHDDDDETGDKIVQFLEILKAEADADEQNDEHFLLETGDWCPADLAWQGGKNEVQGLFATDVFEIMGRERPEGRFVSMRMIRRWTGDIIKSMLCLQDVAYTQALGG